MVWVSNQSSEPLKVTITNKTGGDASVFSVIDRTIEIWANNHWNRGGPETATISFVATNRKLTITVQKDDKVEVFDDSYLVIPNVAAARV